jgi:very-short-patch-repair endonuclease
MTVSGRPHARGSGRPPVKGGGAPQAGGRLVSFPRDLREKFARQKPLGGYVVEFYCSRLRRVVEVDGDSHFTEVGEAHDAARTAVLESLNLQVLRFTNAEVMRDFEGVCCRIRQVIGTKKT